MPKGREVEDEDSFVFNDEFNAPLYRIKVKNSLLVMICLLKDESYLNCIINR